MGLWLSMIGVNKMLDISPQIEQAIINQAQQQGVTINQLLADIFAPQQPQLLSDFIKAMPNRSYLGDGLAIQKELRNEWD